MLSFYLILIGSYLYYCQSTYFPANLHKIRVPWSTRLAFVCLGVATVLFVREYSWASGLLLTISVFCVALMLIQLAAVLGKAYFYSLAALAHGLMLLDLID